MRTGDMIRIALLILILLPLTLFAAEDERIFGSAVTHKRGSLGVGYGLPYGGLGFSGDFYLNDDIGITGSLGTYGTVTGYGMGMKYMLGSFQNTFRPKLTAMYGVNGMIFINRDEPLNDIVEAFSGLTAAVGAQWMFGDDKRHGFDVDILYVITSGMYKRIEEYEEQGYIFTKAPRTKFSFGYRYAF